MNDNKSTGETMSEGSPVAETKENESYSYIKEFLDGLSEEERAYAQDCLNGKEDEEGDHSEMKQKFDAMNESEEPVEYSGE
jgi:hypothetical protein